MVTKTLAYLGRPRLGFAILVVVVAIVALGTYLAAGNGAAKPPRPRVQSPAASSGSAFGPPPNAKGFAEVLVSVSNAFAARQGDPTRLSRAHCVEATRGHYMCAYLVSRPGRPDECHLMQAEWARERASSFTVVLSGRARRCGSVREAIRSLS
jgi:hypothetical protein